MSKFKLYIEYDGSRYAGWQKQLNAKSIQGVLLESASKFIKGNIDIQGSGRTDSGVHALCQVAHLEANTMLAPEILKLKFNDIIPYDINILEVEKTIPNFHARHDATGRSYIYQIAKRRTSFGKQYVWWIKDSLNLNSMINTAKLFQGMHDFISFTDKNTQETSTKVLVEEIEIKETDDLVLLRIRGSHFLWKMVRRIAGILVEIGRGNLSEKDINRFLNTKTNEPAKYTAPPSGLFLEQVLYKGENWLDSLNPAIPITTRKYPFSFLHTKKK